MLSAWLSLAGHARAQPVALDFGACEKPAQSEVRALLALELRARLLAPGSAETPDTQHVQVSCAAEQAELWLRDTKVLRSVPLSSVPEPLRARLLALAIAELTRLESAPVPPQLPAQAPAPSGPPVTPQAPAAPKPPAARPSQRTAETPARYALWAGLETQVSPLFSLGGSVLLRVRVWKLLAWSSALSFSQTRTDIDRGELRVRSSALRTGPALLLERGRWSPQVGLGARLTLVQLAGDPDDAESTAAARFSTFTLAPALFGGVGYRVGRRAFVALELQLSYALQRVRAVVQGGGARTLSAFQSGACLGAGATW